MIDKKEKEFLRDYYPDYNPKYHDAFTLRYQKERDKEETRQYMIRRGIIKDLQQRRFKNGRKKTK